MLIPFSEFQLLPIAVIFLAQSCYGDLGDSFWYKFESAGQKCTGGNGLKYLSGDALTDSPGCLGPANLPYPR